MVLGCLRGEPAENLTDYLCKVLRSPLRHIRHAHVSVSNKILTEPQTQISNPPLCERVRRDCISDEMCAAMDARVNALREAAQRNVRQSSQKICMGLSIDRKRRAEEGGRNIDFLILLCPLIFREALVRMRGWYRDTANRPPPLACVFLETLKAERVELYSHVLPPGIPIPIEVAPLPVDENILGEEEISEAVLQLRIHCA